MSLIKPELINLINLTSDLLLDSTIKLKILELKKALIDNTHNQDDLTDFWENFNTWSMEYDTTIEELNVVQTYNLMDIKNMFQIHVCVGLNLDICGYYMELSSDEEN
jgi:hypothetical protein